MALFDFTLDELREYRPDRAEPDDFDAFWRATLQEVRSHPLDATFDPFDAGLATVETFDVTFSGWNGERVRGWFVLPRRRSGPLPCVVQYLGYTVGRGLVLNH